MEPKQEVLCFKEIHWQGLPLQMPSAKCYRDKAAKCRVLARAQAGNAWAGRLVRLAEEYEAKAAEVGRAWRVSPGEGITRAPSLSRARVTRWAGRTARRG